LTDKFDEMKKQGVLRQLLQLQQSVSNSSNKSPSAIKIGSNVAVLGEQSNLGTPTKSSMALKAIIQQLDRENASSESSSPMKASPFKASVQNENDAIKQQQQGMLVGQFIISSHLE
jgi:hypothetical protein